MAGPLPTIAVFDEGTRLGALRGLFQNPRFILGQIGALTTAETMAAFKNQRLGNVPWKSRGDTGMNPNWPAIIRDLTQGSTPPARRFDDRPALMDKGNLARSFSWRIVSQDTVEIGTMLRYADALHAGLDTKTDPVTKTVQQRLYEWMKKTKADLGRAQAAPQRRENKEKKQAVKNDAEVKALTAALESSKRTYAGQKVPKHERERRQRLAAKLKDRKRVVANVAVARSEEITESEGVRLGKAQRAADGAQKIRWLLSARYTGQRLTVKHPARPMVGVPKTLVEKIEVLVGVKVRAA